MQNSKLNELITIIDGKVVIEDIISEHVNLEKRGSNFFGLCPFHHDSNPSMSVSPTKKIYKCFSCGASGNTISFVQNINGITFIEAVKKLSERYGIDWTQYLNSNFKIDSESEIIKRINNELTKFYKYSLEQEIKSNKILSKYLEQRKITKREIELFKIGFASKSDKIYDYLLKRGFEEKDILKVGILRNNEGKLNSIFFNRIIFPILDENGDTLGFSGRNFKKEDNIKYLNSSENKVFRKSNILYNLNLAKKSIIQRKKVIIVEGFMDVIALNKIGIENVIATMGTALTVNHVKKIQNFTNNVILSFDSDKAGINASIQSYTKFSEMNFSTKFYWLSNGIKDFDELVNEKNKKITFEEIENESKDFVDFYVANYVDKISNNDFNNKIISEISQLISKENDLIKRKLYFKRMESILYEKLKFEINLENILETNKSNFSKENKKTNEINEIENPTKLSRHEIILNNKIFENESKIIRRIITKIDDIDYLKENYLFQNYILRSIFDKIIFSITLYKEKNIEEFLNEILSENELQFITSKEFEETRNILDEKIPIKELIEKTKIYVNKYNLSLFMSKLKKSNSVDEKQELLKHIKRLQNDLKKF